MLATNHVLLGASIGVITKNPVLAFTAGTLSHLVLDSIPHWGASSKDYLNEKLFIRVAKIDGITLLTIFALIAILPLENKLPIILGGFGGLLFDLDKPFMYFFKIKLWPNWFNKLNVIIQKESPKRWWVELTGAIIFSSLLLYLLSR
jgi:hypothetical protein